MARRLRVTSPIVALRDTPVTTGMCFILAVYCFWMGTILWRTVQFFPPDRLIGYAGPTSLMPIYWWGWAYIAAGVVGMLRLFFHDDPTMNLSLHLVKMCVLVGWAVAFDLGPPSTGQPAYTLVAIVSFSSAFLINIIQGRYGVPRPTLPPRH